ncbi:MAG TPA: ArsA family ATPase, partial [Terriglobales bacterium]|nr:ArsA family ATPase [Terriglobales bacterium]
LLADLRKNAGVVLVTTAEPFALQESARVAAQMRDMQPPLRFTRMVLNRAVTASSSCEVCSARYAEARRARQYLRQHFPRLPMLVAPDLGAPVVGVNQLLSYGRRVFGRGRLATKTALPAMRKPPRLKASRWPAVEQQLSITLGKGGVGKTTISAAMAVRLRERNKPAQVAVCSTDPAPSLDDVFEQPVGAQLSSVAGDEGLLSAEIDAAGEFHSWAEAMNRRIEGALTASPSAGIRVDLSFERQLFSALLDVVPPGIDELFAVLKISKLLRGKGDTRLVLDMAPTGHALELLRTPERILHWSRLLLKTLALHRTLPFARNIGAELAQLASDVRWLQGRLRAADATAAWVVMLAEPLPDRETARLVAQLHSLRVPLTGIVVNRVLFGRNLRCPRCRTRAAWQASSLAGLRKNLPPDLKIYCLADQEHGISGVEGLKRFSRKIWRLA